MDKHDHYRTDPGESAQWRSDFQETFRTAFIALATLAPGDWQWRFEWRPSMAIVIRSAAAGCVYSRVLPNDSLRRPAYTAALMMAEELRRWIEERETADG